MENQRWYFWGLSAPPKGLSMSCLEPLNAFNFTAVIRADFLGKHPLWTTVCIALRQIL